MLRECSIAQNPSRLHRRFRGRIWQKHKLWRKGCFKSGELSQCATRPHFDGIASVDA